MNYIQILEYIGICSFAFSGANTAVDEKFDLFGILMLSVVTAMGGGVLRDIVLDSGIPKFFVEYSNIPFILIGAILAVFVKSKLQQSIIFIIIDALGLAAFFISSAIYSMSCGHNILLYLFTTSITGVGGGILRDILVRRKPVVFTSDLYCISGIVGAVFFRVFYNIIPLECLQIISILIIITVRTVSYVMQINLPKIKNSD